MNGLTWTKSAQTRESTRVVVEVLPSCKLCVSAAIIVYAGTERPTTLSRQPCDESVGAASPLALCASSTHGNCCVTIPVVLVKEKGYILGHTSTRYLPVRVQLAVAERRKTSILLDFLNRWEGGCTTRRHAHKRFSHPPAKNPTAPRE